MTSALCSRGRLSANVLEDVGDDVDDALLVVKARKRPEMGLI